MVDKVKLQEIIECIHINCPDWEGSIYRGQLKFKRDRLTVDVEVPDQWQPGNTLTLAVEATLRKRFLTKTHVWIFNTDVSPQFITNEGGGFPDDVFDAIQRLWNEVSLRLRLLK